MAKDSSLIWVVVLASEYIKWVGACPGEGQLGPVKPNNHKGLRHSLNFCHCY